MIAQANAASDRLFPVAVQGTETDERYTPAWIFAALGEHFDLDPCSPVAGGDCVPVNKRLTRADNGLAHHWDGFVWCNPPFSNATPWAKKFMEHANGMWLGPVANAHWRLSMDRRADLLWLMNDFAFTHPTHAGRRSSMPLSMYAFGDRAIAAMQRAAAQLPDAGTLFRRVPHSRNDHPTGGGQ